MVRIHRFLLELEHSSLDFEANCFESRTIRAILRESPTGPFSASDSEKLCARYNTFDLGHGVYSRGRCVKSTSMAEAVTALQARFVFLRKNASEELSETTSQFTQFHNTEAKRITLLAQTVAILLMSCCCHRDVERLLED